MTRRPGGRAIALSAVVAVLLLLPSVPAPLRVLAAYHLLGVLPGWLLCRGFPGSGTAPPEQIAAAALVASIPLGMLLGIVLMWHPARGAALAMGLGVVLATAAWFLPAPQGPRPRGDPRAWFVCVGAGLLTALPLLSNPVLRVYGDALFHGQIVEEILTHGLPPQDPAFAGMPLAYAWPLHAWIAALVRFSGTTAFAVFPCLALASATGMALVFLRLARLAGLSGDAARVSVVVSLTAMNALGWLQALLRFALAPYLGHDRGGPGLWEQLATLIRVPNAGAIASSLMLHGHFVLSSFLFKFACVNSVGVALLLAAGAMVAAMAHLRSGAGGAAFFAGLYTAGAALAHPVIGLSAALSLGVGLSATLLAGGNRRPAALTLLCVVLGGSVALPPLLAMLAAPIRTGAPTHVHPYAGNALALVQVLAVSAPLAVLGWRRARHDDARLAWLAAGYAAAAIGFSLVVEFPSDAFAYPVYIAYLGTACFLPHAVAAIRDAGKSRAFVRFGSRVGVALLPTTTVLLLLGFARHDAHWGWAGYPATGDERAVFDRLRAAPDTAVVIDTQNFEMSAAAAYSARRSLFGGMAQVRLVGYPVHEMEARERAIRDLLYSGTTSDSTWRLLDRYGPSLYVVARRDPSGGRVFDGFERPPGRPIAKLDGLPERLDPVLHTPTIALYRYRDRSGR